MLCSPVPAPGAPGTSVAPLANYYLTLGRYAAKGGLDERFWGCLVLRLSLPALSVKDLDRLSRAVVKVWKSDSREHPSMFRRVIISNKSHHFTLRYSIFW